MEKYQLKIAEVVEEATGTKSFYFEKPSDYYETLSNLTLAADGMYYIVGNDDFMKETIKFLNSMGIVNSNIIIDRKEEKLGEYFQIC